jgi:purine-binding chemotaxis protein CheW
MEGGKPLGQVPALGSGAIGNSKPSNEDEASNFLIFKLGSERFGCPLLQVREVVKVPQIKALPQKIKYLKGIANLKGQVLSVMDLRLRLGMDAVDTPECLMFIVRVKGIHLGLVVDSAESVVHIPKTDIENPLSINPKIPVQFFIGIGKLGESLIHLLDLESLVSELAPEDSEQGS